MAATLLFFFQICKRMRVVTEHTHVTTAHAHVATFYQYDRFANLTNHSFND